MSWDCEIPSFFKEAYPKAKKEYSCCECSAPINKGEKYGYYCGKWDGTVSVYRQHILCRDACVWVRDKFQSGDCLCFGGLREVISEYCYPEKYKFKPEYAVFRHMIAEIKWRERQHEVR